MINLKEETLDVLDENGKAISDIVWCGYDDCWFSIDDFLALADFEYDNGYGGTYIPMDLVVVGNDFWLERSEYDGAEGWDFKTMPARPSQYNDSPRLK